MDISHQKSESAEKSLLPHPLARAKLILSRVEAAIGIGIFPLLALSIIRDISLCAKSIENQGSISFLKTFEAKFIFNWPFVAVVP